LQSFQKGGSRPPKKAYAMEHFTAFLSLIVFSGEDWFDPLEDAIRFRVRAFIEAMAEEEAEAPIGGKER